MPCKFLAAAFLVVLLGLIQASCAVPATPASAPSENRSSAVVERKLWPHINAFSVSSDNITPGENVTLSWDVADADVVTMDSGVGQLPASGAISVKPERTTKYTLTAAGGQGIAQGWVTVQVADKSTILPDLVITGITYISGLLYYTVKNTGAVDAGPSTTFLFDRSGVQKDQSWVSGLKAGESKTLPFTNYDYDGSQISICADGGNELKEASKDNNCYIPSFGFKYSYDLQQYASRATWRGSAGRVAFGPAGDTAAGLADRPGQAAAADGNAYRNPIEMFPPDGSYQWIEGYFGDWQGQWQTGGYMLPLELPANTRFTARVGLSGDAGKGSGATFLFGLQDSGGNVNWWPGVRAANDGKLNVMDIDLSSYGGKKVMAVLRVESGAVPDRNYGLWIDAKISQ